MRRIDPRQNDAGRGGSTRAEPTGAPRFAEFDALRATAIGLVVTLHAALAYTHRDIPRLLWGVREPGRGVVVDWGCWWAMAVSVPLFFTISGFLAARTVATRGAVEFWRGRVRRVVVPSFAGAVFILPGCFGAWAVGWLVSGRCTWREVMRLRFRDPAIEDALYGPAHLWFVAYLIPILWAYSRSRVGRPRPGPGAPILLHWYAPLLLAIPSTVLLLLNRRFLGVDAGLDRHNTIFPEPIRLLHYGLFFLVGAALHDTPGLLDRIRRRGWVLLLASVPVFAARTWILPVDWLPDSPWSTSLLACLGGALGSWLAVFGLIGAYGRVFRRPSVVARYLAGASFWVYLVHLPIAGLIQADLYGASLTVPAKFAITWGLTVALALGSYEVLVRRTRLGRFLDGRASDRPKVLVPPSARLGSGPVLTRPRRRPPIHVSRRRR